MEYELEEWLDEPETRPVANLEAPLIVLSDRIWTDPSDYVRNTTQSAELIPEEAWVTPALNPRAGLVQLD